MNNLDGKTALITGAGQGLGEAISNVLAEAGATVISADIIENNAKKVAASIKEKGFKAEGLYLDVRDENNIKEILKLVTDRFGHLDILINNAGTDSTKPIEDLTVDEWNRIIAVNLTGPFLLTKFSLPLMAKQKKGHIINIASTAAKRAWANTSAYHSSKWGLLGLSYASFVEARQNNIKVTAVIAGGMKTPFLLERFPDIDTSKLQDPKNVAETIKFILTQPNETIIPEVMVIPLQETSWP